MSRRDVLQRVDNDYMFRRWTPEYDATSELRELHCQRRTIPPRVPVEQRQKRRRPPAWHKPLVVAIWCSYATCFMWALLSTRVSDVWIAYLNAAAWFALASSLTYVWKASE